MSELRFHIRLLLFLSSFAPLWMILSIFLISNQRNFDVIEQIMLIILLFITIVPIIILVLFIYKGERKTTEKTTLTVKTHSNITKEFMIYLVTYTIPFVLYDTFDHYDFLAILIFTCAIGSIYLKSDMIFINPLFAFMNYKLHRIVNSKNTVCYILTKNDLFNNNIIKTVRLDRYFYIEQKKEKYDENL